MIESSQKSPINGNYRALKKLLLKLPHFQMPISSKLQPKKSKSKGQV
jgi:hypothetical protein